MRRGPRNTSWLPFLLVGYFVLLCVLRLDFKVLVCGDNLADEEHE